MIRLDASATRSFVGAIDTTQARATASVDTTSRFLCDAIETAAAPKAAAQPGPCACMACGTLLPQAGAANTNGGSATTPALAGAGAALTPNITADEVHTALAPLLPDLVTRYKDIHMHPELGGNEARTAKLFADRLKELGYQVTEGFGQYTDPSKPVHSVIGVFENGPGPTMYLRADMDALPLTEVTGAPYASQTPGVMHACGHDIHTTAGMGTADLMVKMKDRWSGKLVILGQPSEELGTGARALVDHGLFEKFGNPDVVFAVHDRGDLLAGQLTTVPGFALANVDSVDVTLHGKGSHGAAPEAGIDPVVMFAQFVLGVQPLVSRRTPPGTPAVVTIGKADIGTVRNIIPSDVTANMTLRSFGPTERKLLNDGVKAVANGVTTMAGSPTPPTVTHLDDQSIDAVFNEPTLTTKLGDMWQTMLGKGFLPTEQMMAGDDFTYYSGLTDTQERKYPIVYSFVGANSQETLDKAKQDGVTPPSPHMPTFLPVPEPTIEGAIMASVTFLSAFAAKKSA